MTVVLLILLGVSVVAVAFAVKRIVAKRREQRALREELGDDYDEYLRIRRKHGR